MNSIDYKIFYPIIALLLIKILSSTKHNSVMSLFFKESINTGIIDKQCGMFYTDIFDLRMKYDCKIPAKITKEDFERWIKKSRDFIKIVNNVTLNLLDSNVNN